MKKILIVGGAGYIGSHVNKMLHQVGYDTIILDNLSRGNRNAVTRGHFIEGDMSDTPLLNHMFSENKIDAVMHFAAFIDVRESVEHPAKYYTNNVAHTLNLLNAMQRHKVQHFIFSSTASIYGNPVTIPMSENHPTEPINPYGASKLMIETILADLKNIRYCSLRYFNAAGGDPEGEIRNYQTKPTHLIPIVLNSLRTKTPVTIYGTDYETRDGTALRDYIHVNDLARAHIQALELPYSSCFNLGNGIGFTVKEVIAAVENVTGEKVETLEGPRRAGDPPILLANSDKARRELGWVPQTPSLEKIIEDAYCIYHEPCIK